MALVREELSSITGISAGHIGPDLTHFASRKTFAGSLMVTNPDNLAKWIENPEHMKPGALMPNLGMKGEQSKALAAYLRTLKPVAHVVTNGGEPTDCVVCGLKHGGGDRHGSRQTKRMVRHPRREGQAVVHDLGQREGSMPRPRDKI